MGGAGAGRQGGLWTWAPGAGELVRPLWPQEYLSNVVVDRDVSLHSWRLSWETRLHFDDPTYISTHYGQVSPPGPTLLCRWPVRPGLWLEEESLPSGEGPAAGRGFGAQLHSHCPPTGAAGLPAGQAVGQRPGRHPAGQAGCLAAPQQGALGAPLRVSVNVATPSVTPDSLLQGHGHLHPSWPFKGGLCTPAPHPTSCSSRAGPTPHSCVWIPSLTIATCSLICHLLYAQP